MTLHWLWFFFTSLTSLFLKVLSSTAYYWITCCLDLYEEVNVLMKKKRKLKKNILNKNQSWLVNWSCPNIMT